MRIHNKICLVGLVLAGSTWLSAFGPATTDVLWRYVEIRDTTNEATHWVGVPGQPGRYAVHWENFDALYRQRYVRIMPRVFFATPSIGWVVDPLRCWLLSTTDSGRICLPLHDLEDDQRDRLVKAGWRNPNDPRQGVLLLDEWDPNPTFRAWLNRRDLQLAPRVTPGQDWAVFKSTDTGALMTCRYAGINWQQMTMWYTEDGGLNWHAAHIPWAMRKWRLMGDVEIRKHDGLLVLEAAYGEPILRKYYSADEGRTWLLSR